MLPFLHRWIYLLLLYVCGWCIRKNYPKAHLCIDKGAHVIWHASRSAGLWINESDIYDAHGLFLREADTLSVSSWSGCGACFVGAMSWPSHQYTTQTVDESASDQNRMQLAGNWWKDADKRFQPIGQWWCCLWVWNTERHLPWIGDPKASAISQKEHVKYTHVYISPLGNWQSLKENDGVSLQERVVQCWLKCETWRVTVGTDDIKAR